MNRPEGFREAGKYLKSADIGVNVIWVDPMYLNLEEAKELSKWLKKAIKYLEAKRGRTDESAQGRKNRTRTRTTSTT